MTAKSMAKSIQMLKAVLDGQTYDTVAKTAKMTHSAVEQRVKALARDLQAVVGVDGIDESAVPTVLTMRKMRDSYLEALAHYQPERAKRMRARKSTVTEQEIDLAIDKIRQMSNCRNRDIALLLALFSTAAKPLEIARLEVRDYLNENGSIREESTMRAEAAIGGAARPLFFASAKANAAIDAYLQERVRRRQGVHQSRKYRGLDPMSRLFLTDEGNAIPIKIKEQGKQRHHLCSVIQNIYRKIFARAGLEGVSALSARRTIAQKLKERGTNNDDIGKVLGLKEKNSVRNLLPKQGRPLKSVVKELV